jgi:hypothetical protein
MRSHAAVLGSLALLALALLFYDFETPIIFGGLFLIGFFIYTRVASVLPFERSEQRVASYIPYWLRRQRERI